MTSEVYYNALRYCLIQQINLIKAKNVLPYKGEVLDNYVLRSGFLGEIEGFTPQDMDTETKKEEILTLIMNTLKADYGKYRKIQPDKNKTV